LNDYRDPLMVLMTTARRENTNEALINLFLLAGAILVRLFWITGRTMPGE